MNLLALPPRQLGHPRRRRIHLGKLADGIAPLIVQVVHVALEALVVLDCPLGLLFKIVRL